MAENTNLCNDEWEVSRSHEILALSLACCSDHDLKRKKNQQTTGKIKNVTPEKCLATFAKQCLHTGSKRC